MVAAPALAQSLVEGQGVADRARPDYDPRGLQEGAFTLYPAIGLNGVATDNYLATDTDRRGDVYLIAKPQLSIRNEDQRNRFQGDTFFDRSFHAELPHEDANEYGVSVSDAYAATRDLDIRADAAADRFIESRSSLGAFQGSKQPVAYDYYHGGLDVSKVFNDLTFNLLGGINRYRYHNTELDDGTPIDQTYRSDLSTNIGGSVQYALHSGIGLIVSGEYDNDRYDLRPGHHGYDPLSDINRNSHGFTIEGGVTLELSHLIVGSLQVGYLQRDYDDARLNNFGGLSFNANVLWNVTGLTSVRFRASRTIQATSSPDVAGDTRSDFSVTVDHELYRYIIVSADLGYGHFTPNGVGVGGDEYNVGLRARYLINRRFTLTGGLGYAGRASDSIYLRYHAFTGSLGLRIAY